MKTDQGFRLDFDVRDYECDLTGIVNNANYLHYLEHARHIYLKQNSVGFETWFQRGFKLVVVRMEVDYLYSLRSGDKFYVTVKPRQVSRLRLVFSQEIIRLEDEMHILRAEVTATALNDRGRPELPHELVESLLGNGSLCS